MEKKISELRHAKVLPSRTLAELSTEEYSGITVHDKGFYTTPKWWQYEDKLTIHFNKGPSVPGDISKRYDTMCEECQGACCKDIPTHNLRMYMSQSEIEKACNQFDIKAPDFIEDYITIDNTEFGILKIKENGDCGLLTDTGCEFGDYRPLWCKLWVCEILQEEIGGIKNEYRSSQVSKK